MKDKNHILVTGGAGMIGSNLVKMLVQNGQRVSVVDNLWRGLKENLYDDYGNAVIDIENDFHQIDLSVPGSFEHIFKGVDYRLSSCRRGCRH